MERRALGVSQGRAQGRTEGGPEHPGAGRGGQCHHQSCELRVILQGYYWHDPQSVLSKLKFYKIKDNLPTFGLNIVHFSIKRLKI